MPDFRPYAGRWVALVAGRVAGSGATPAEARLFASHNRPRQRSVVGFVTLDGEARLLKKLPLAPLVERLRRILSQNEPAVYLVGGAVRDALLGRVSHDLDFAIAGDAISLARHTADELGGDFYLLDRERGTSRVLSGETVIDFAQLRGADLGYDLCDRDFTINAMALPLETADPDAIIDPLGGQHDLSAGLIRATNPAAIDNDPIRGLRAIRLRAELGFQITAETLTLINQAASRLEAISAERVRDEFCRLLNAPKPAESLWLMDEVGLFCQVLPELSTLKGLTQSPPHTTDAFTHSLLAVEKTGRLLRALASTSPVEQLRRLAPGVEDLAPMAPELATYLERTIVGNRDGHTLLLLGALLHDLGKADTRSVDSSSRIRFIGHEETGAELVIGWMKQMAFSNNEIRQVATMVRHHMRPAQLAQTAARPSRRAIYRFFRDSHANGLDICLLCLADGLAKGENGTPDDDDWERRIETVVILLDHFLHHYDEAVRPSPLIDGFQLMNALDLTAGPIVGRLLREIEEAQAAGEVGTVTGALELARQSLKRGR